MKVHYKPAMPFLLYGLGILLLTGCTGKTWQEFQLARDRDSLENNTPAFDPGYFKNQSSQHFAIFFDIVDGQLSLSSRAAELRPGSLPYQSRSAGDVKIVYFDSTGKELGEYAVENPILARSCDLEGRPPRGDTKPLLKGTVEVLLPNNFAITHVEVGPIKKKGKRFQVGKVIQARRDPSHRTQ